MPSRAESLADKFEQAVAGFASTIERIPDDKWNAKGGPEGWTVAGVAQHVSGQFPLEMQYITAAAEGKPLPGYSWDDINGMNESRAQLGLEVALAFCFLGACDPSGGGRHRVAK